MYNRLYSNLFTVISQLHCRQDTTPLQFITLLLFPTGVHLYHYVSICILLNDLYDHYLLFIKYQYKYYYSYTLYTVYSYMVCYIHTHYILLLINYPFHFILFTIDQTLHYNTPYTLIVYRVIYNDLNHTLNTIIRIVYLNILTIVCLLTKVILKYVQCSYLSLLSTHASPVLLTNIIYSLLS